MRALHWQNYHDVKSKISAAQKDWLFDQGSLTKRLTLLSQNKFSLEILSESQQYLREDECKVLNIPFVQTEWVREVLLKGNNIPWVYARSIILSDVIKKNDPESLKNIGNQPLGSVLFDTTEYTRSSIEVTQYPEDLLPCPYSFPSLWARRSCFKNKIYTILVQEIFLSAFEIELL